MMNYTLNGRLRSTIFVVFKFKYENIDPKFQQKKYTYRKLSNKAPGILNETHETPFYISKNVCLDRLGICKNDSQISEFLN